MESPLEPQFNPEAYRGRIVDIVHRGSIERILSGKKPAEANVRNKAAIVARNIKALEEAGIDFRDIENPSQFIRPEGDRSVVIGGAFVGECLADYTEAAAKAGVELKPDPWLSVELD